MKRALTASAGAPKRRIRLCIAVALSVALTPAGQILWPTPALGAPIGGVNTGQPGSTCAASDGGLPYTAPAADISTTALGAAPANYELGLPTGAFLDQPPKGLMITIHGGGWYVVGPGGVAAERPTANLWRNRGWATLNITYRSCAQSVADVLWFHDAARQLVGPNVPLCATGASSGAHLALMMASSRSDVACVIADGAPTNLLSLQNEMAYNPATGLSDQSAGPAWVHYLAVAAFGISQLDAMSPALHPGTARLFLATAEQDEFVPWAQAQQMATAAGSAAPGTYADVQQLAAGTAPVTFVHVSASKGTDVSQPAYNDYLVRQLKTVAPMLASPGVTNSVINDIRVPGWDGYSLGDSTFETTVRTADAQSSVSGRITLAPGRSFNVMSCVAYFDPVRAPLSACNQSFVDTRGKLGETSAPLPAATATWPRPAAGTGNGFAYGVVWIWYLDVTNQWVLVATSMPDRSVDSGASVPPSVG